MMERQMKNVPKAQQEQILKMVEQNPELFQKIGKEIQAEVKRGRPQMAATMDVMKKYRSELQQLQQ